MLNLINISKKWIYIQKIISTSGLLLDISISPYQDTCKPTRFRLYLMIMICITYHQRSCRIPLL